MDCDFTFVVFLLTDYRISSSSCRRTSTLEAGRVSLRTLGRCVSVSSLTGRCAMAVARRRHRGRNVSGRGLGRFLHSVSTLGGRVRRGIRRKRIIAVCLAAGGGFDACAVSPRRRLKGVIFSSYEDSS